MPKSTYVVSSQGSVLVKVQDTNAVSVMLKPGEVVPPGLLTSDQMKIHIKNGFIRRVDAPEKPDISGAAAPRIRRDGTPGDHKIEKLNLNPNDLKRKPLSSLNEIVHKLDPTQPSFQDKGSAIAFLSSDLVDV